MDVLKKFNSVYQVYSMNRNSLTLMNRDNGSMTFIHRKAYNALLRNQCEDFREVEREFTHDGRDCRTSKWVEVLTWVSI